MVMVPTATPDLPHGSGAAVEAVLLMVLRRSLVRNPITSRG